MKPKLSEKLCREAEPGLRDRVIYDGEIAGLGLVVYQSGRRAFLLTYRFEARQRRFTIGTWPDWSVVAAREEAKRLKREIDRGVDPLGVRDEAREAPNVGALIDRYCREHLPRLAERNAADQRSLLAKIVRPAWGTRKVAEIASADVDALLNKIAEGRARPSKAKPKNRRRKLVGARPTPIRANRAGEVLRKMFALAVKWGMRADNPAVGFYRRMETERERFLAPEEIGRLADALAKAPDQKAAQLVRMLMLTGARSGEVREAQFDEFDLALGVWTKPAARTKQRKAHRLPISAETAAIVRQRRQAVPQTCPWLFPNETLSAPVGDVRKFWAAIQKAAAIPDVRIHDIRHTFASLLASGGASLLMIGKLLGHSQLRTTQRYAHLVDSPLRGGVDAVAEALGPRLRVVGGSDS